MNSWILVDDGKVGTEKQCLALAEALSLSPSIYRLKACFPWRCLPSRLWVSPLDCVTPKLTPPWPDLIIAAGRQSVAPAAAIRKQGKTKVIALQNPLLPLTDFDIVIAPTHDNLKGRNVIQTIGALPYLTDQILKKAKEEWDLDHFPSPKTAVLIGGPNKHYQMGETEIRKMIDSLLSIYQTEGGSFFVTVSRRTPVHLREMLKLALQPFPHVYWDGEGPNPYVAFLAHADRILVTQDSVSMACEAAFTGKPLYIYPLKGSSKKFNRFHQDLSPYARPFEGHLNPFSKRPLREIDRILPLLQLH